MTQTTWGQKVTWPPPRAPSNPRPNMQYAYSWYSWQRSLLHGSPWPLVCGWDCSKLKRLTELQATEFCSLATASLRIRVVEVVRCLQNSLAKCSTISYDKLLQDQLSITDQRTVYIALVHYRANKSLPVLTFKPQPLALLLQVPSYFPTPVEANTFQVKICLSLTIRSPTLVNEW